MTSQATPSGASRGSQRSSTACNSAFPTWVGGLLQIWSNVTPAGTASGSDTRIRSARPSDAAFSTVSSRAREFTSIAYTSACGASSARTAAIGP
jgi:hypothetical protein